MSARTSDGHDGKKSCCQRSPPTANDVPAGCRERSALSAHRVAPRGAHPWQLLYLNAIGPGLGEAIAAGLAAEEVKCWPLDDRIASTLTAIATRRRNPAPTPSRFNRPTTFGPISPASPRPLRPTRCLAPRVPIVPRVRNLSSPVRQPRETTLSRDSDYVRAKGRSQTGPAWALRSTWPWCAG